MRRGERGRVVLDSRRREDLAPARGVERVHFIGRTGQGADLASAPVAPERSEGGCPPAYGPLLLVIGELDINEIDSNGLDAELWT